MSRAKFAGFELNLETGYLEREGERVRLQPQPSRVLLCLVSRPGELVTRDELRRQVWGEGYVDFDQGINNAIRQIRAALGDEADSPRLIETIPRRGYRLLVPVEEVEEGARRPLDGTPQRWSKVALRRSVLVAALAVCLSATALIAGRALFRGTAPRSLLVLPVEDLSRDPQPYLAAGLTEELTTELAGIDPARLRVVGVESARQASASREGGKRAARGLRTAYRLRTSLRQQDERARVSVQLVATDSGEHLWAESFDGTVDDLIGLERDLARRVASAMAERILGSRHPSLAARATDPYARRAYLEGRHLAGRGDLASLEAAVASFDTALERSPGYAPALASRARALLQLSDPDGRRRQAALADAEQAVRRAPDLAEAHLARGDLALFFEWDVRRAGDEYRRALALEPGTSASHTHLAFYLASQGRPREAIARIRKALEIDPVAASVQGDAILVCFFARDFEAMLAEARHLGSLEPDHPLAASGEIRALFALGRDQEATVAAAAQLRRSGVAEASLQGLLRSDAVPPRQAYLELRRASLAGLLSPGADASLLAQLGRTEEALAALERALAERSEYIAFLAVDPDLDPLRDDPRFQRLQARAGLAAP